QSVRLRNRVTANGPPRPGRIPTGENSLMSLLSDWNSHEKELQDALTEMRRNKQEPPQDVVALLKTRDLKAALKLADEAERKDDSDGIRKAQSKSQKFFLMYANQYKAAKVATQADPDLSDLNDLLNMFNVYMTRTQVGVARLADAMIQEAKKTAATEEKRKQLEIKSALAPLRFQYDWKAAKKDFENETGVKKPSTKILGEYRKSTGVDSALGEMDKACKKADPDAYRKAYS